MKLFGKSGKTVTGLEIGNRWLKIVRIDVGKAKNVVVDIIKENIERLSAEQIEGAVKRALPDTGSGLFFISIPRYFVTTRTLELPSTDPEEIKSMIDLQIGKQTPYSGEDVISNHQIIDIDGIEGYSRVALAIVHKDIVQRQLDILKKAGLKVDKIVLSSEGLLKWSETVYKKIPGDKPYMLIDIDYNDSDFEIIFKGKPMFSKSVSVGSVNFESDRNGAVEKLNKEINHFVYDYQNTVINHDIGEIIVTGADSAVKELRNEGISGEIGGIVKECSQFDNMNVAEEVKRRVGTDMPGVSFAGCIGAISAYEGLEGNFLPREIILEKEVKKRARDIYTAGVLLMLIPLLVSGIFLERVYNKSFYLTELRNSLRESKDKTGELNEMIEKIGLIKKQINTKSVSLNLFFETYKAITPEIYLLSISFDGKDKLTLRGTSNIMSDVFRFVNRLEESKYFENVKTKYANVRKVNEGKEVVDFEITCRVVWNSEEA